MNANKIEEINRFDACTGCQASPDLDQFYNPSLKDYRCYVWCNNPDCKFVCSVQIRNCNSRETALTKAAIEWNKKQLEFRLQENKEANRKLDNLLAIDEEE